jgi:hypothetical protein
MRAAIIARLARAPVALALALALALATAPAPVAHATAAPRAQAASVACGAGAARVLANTAGSVAERIYASEVRSSETESDKRQIESYAPLLSAVESGDHAAIEAAVNTLVYSHTHIVRLRVDRGSELLADVGGPYILAPIAGTLRAHGKTIGHFVFSVQDDLGYVKLVTRFIGVPLVLRTDSGQVPVEGQLSPGPASIPDLAPVDYHDKSYEAYSFNVSAYPSGRLRVSLLVPASHAPSTRTCEQVKAAELGVVAQRISRRFSLSPSAFAPYIRLVHTMTHALVYMRAGSRTLAGSTRSTPAKLPSSGVLRFHGATYQVSSFVARTSVGPARVDVLVPG